ncbi:MAG: hypothetical protein AB7C97_11620 [Oscillospiraceae bacterium]
MDIISMAVYILALLGTFVFVVTRRTGPGKDELFRIKETPMTALFGLMILIEAGFLQYFLITKPEQIVATGEGLRNAYLFLFISVALGCCLIMYAFVKTVIVTEKGVICVSLFGSHEEVDWNEIDGIELTRNNRLVLIKGKELKVTVGGDRESFKRFIKMADKKIRPEAGEDILLTLKEKYKV